MIPCTLTKKQKFNLEIKYSGFNKLFAEEFKRSDWYLYENNWKKVSLDFVLSESFIREYENLLYWQYLSQNGYALDTDDYCEELGSFSVFSKELLEDFKDKIDWDYLATEVLPLTEVLSLYKDRINWKRFELINNNLNITWSEEALNMLHDAGISINFELTAN